MNLEDIGEWDDALFCVTDLTACCRPPYNSEMLLGNLFFPNGTRLVSSGAQWDFHRTRGQRTILLHRRRGGVTGIYSCVVPNAINVTQTIYIGVYSANTGELSWPCFELYELYIHSLGARPSGKLACINSLWDVSSLQASYAIIEGVD